MLSIAVAIFKHVQVNGIGKIGKFFCTDTTGYCRVITILMIVCRNDIDLIQLKFTRLIVGCVFNSFRFGLRVRGCNAQVKGGNT